MVLKVEPSDRWPRNVRTGRGEPPSASVRSGTTPLQRLLDSAAADPAKVASLVDLYTAVSPLTLKRQIDRRLDAMPTASEVAVSA